MLSANHANHTKATLGEPEAQQLRAETEAVEQRLSGRAGRGLRREECLRLARLAADYLRARGAVTVRLFGSLARGRAPGVHSDFDFAVEGLPGEAYLGSVGTLLQLLPLPVDLVELESASAALRERILREGLEV
jgi:predicted nucleotidyltransferase